MKKLVFVLLLVCSVSAGAKPTFRMEGDRVWLKMDGRMGLSRVLTLFQERGVQVWLDPSLAGTRIYGAWEDVAVRQLLRELVDPHDFVVEWRRISGPLGSMDMLSGVRIYAEGNPDAAIPLSTGLTVLDVVEPEDGSAPYIRDELLLGFEDGVSEEELKKLLRRMGGTLIEVIDPPGLYRIKLDGTLSVADARALALEVEGVMGAEPNYAFKHPGAETVPSMSGQGLLNLHLPPGKDAVAVFDSGLDPAYFDMSFLMGMYNAVAPDEPMSDPLGHGSVVALVASGAVTPEGAEAATKGVPVLAIRAFDENGFTSSEILMDGLNYALKSGVKYVNMSWGSEVDSAFIRAAMNFAARNGMTLISAAGNEPTGMPMFPAGYPEVIAVGGLDADGRRWSQSNFGDFVEASEPAYVIVGGNVHVGTSISSPYHAYRLAVGAP